MNKLLGNTSKKIISFCRRCFDISFLRKMYLKKNGLLDADLIFTATTPQERDILFSLAAKKKGGIAVEIGSAFGASSCFLAAGIGVNGKLYCIDRWNVEYKIIEGQEKSFYYEPNGRLMEYLWNESRSKYNFIQVGTYKGDCPTYKIFLSNTSNFKNRIEAVRKESSVATEIVKDEIDLLFIDGWHEYKHVLNDVNAWLPKMAKNGIIVMHDYGWAPGVQKVVKELIAPIAKKSGALSNLYWAQL